MDSVTLKYAPFAHQYLQTNYQQSIQANQPTIIHAQKQGQVLEQIQQSFKYERPNQRLESDGIIHQSHTITHPQVRDLYHREASMTVVSREEIESVWRAKCNQLEQALTEVQTEVMRLRGIGMTEKVVYVEDTLKINQLYLEIDRLNKCLLDMSLELENFKHKYHIATDKQSRNIAEIEIDKMRALMLENESIMNGEINRLRSQLDEWQKRYRILELSLSEARGGEGTLKDYENTISSLRQEQDRNNFQLNQAKMDCEEWKGKCQSLEAQLREQSQSEIQIRRLKEMVDNRNREIEALRLNQDFQQDSKLQGLRLDSERMSNELRMKNEEISRLRQQVSQLELRGADTSKYNEMDMRYQSLLRENEQLNQRLVNTRNFDQRLEELQQRNDHLSNTNKQLVLEIDDWKIRYQELDQRCQDLEYQFEQTSSEETVTKLTNDVEIWKRKFMELNKDYHKLQEEQMMTQAELESLKKQKFEVTTSQQTIVRKSQHSQQSSDIKNY